MKFDPNIPINKYLLVDLRKFAKEYNIAKYSSKNKSQLYNELMKMTKKTPRTSPKTSKTSPRTSPKTKKTSPKTKKSPQSKTSPQTSPQIGPLVKGNYYVFYQVHVGNDYYIFITSQEAMNFTLRMKQFLGPLGKGLEDTVSINSIKIYTNADYVIDEII